MKRSFKPYNSGYLDVGQGHELYYEQCGNPNGFPVLYLHGGPGSGFHDKHKEFFNLKRINLTLFDQRGAGRSKPFASVQHNTTSDLVNDINKLLDSLEIDKVFLFGGSWGSTLSLVYAIRNPKRVTGMLLRGIFLGDDAANDHFLNGGVKDFFPENWERFASLVPKSKQGNVAQYYYDKMRFGTPSEKKKFTYEWAYYESSMLSLKPNPEKTKGDMKTFSYKSLAPLEAHYLLNGCFLPKDYILKNANKVKKIPTTIIHGRYDFICEPINAHKLHRALPKSKLIYTVAGHHSSDTETREALVSEMAQMSASLGGR